MKQYEPLVVGAATAGRLEVRSPFDGSLVGRVGQCDHAGVEQAIKVADAAFTDRERWLPLHERVVVLRGLIDLMTESFEDLVDTAVSEGGKPITDTRIEVRRAIDGVHLAVEAIRTRSANASTLDGTVAGAGRVGVAVLEPVGPVVAVSAFNHPVNLIVHQVVAAVAAGCPVIVKPADDTPLSCFKIVDLLHEAGLPPELCQALVTTEISVAEALVTDPRISFFSFIGSAAVGWHLRSKLAPGTRCALEHGGVAPVLVAADADITAAIPPLTTGAFYHAGQVCVSVQRVLAIGGIGDQLARELTAAAAALAVGDPSSPETQVGPLIRPGEVARVHEWVTEAVTDGAELLTGGEPLSDVCYAPTVLRNPPRSARVSTSEIFGPVVCIYDVDSIATGIAQANELPWQFQASVFTRDIATAMDSFRRLRATTIMVNDHTAFRVDNMPFAGLGQSGLGVGGIEHTIADMSIQKTLVVRG